MSPAFLDDDEAEDVHHFVEKQLVVMIGDVGYKLHSGRSRNEQIATDLRLYVRASIDDLRLRLADCLSVFISRAEHAGNAAMPAYTHLRRAEPVLVSHWVLAYVEMFLRDAERVADCRARVNICPLGSGAVAGTTIHLDRRAIAEELGFDAVTSNSVDATSDRDFVLEFVNALTLLSLHLSRWAEEMIIFSSQEFGFVHLPEAYSTGSSAMPQKKNPDLLELVRGKAARVAGDATTLLVAVKGLALAYNKDLQETQQPLFDASETVLSVLPLIAGFMKVVEFDYDRMQKTPESGFMNAWAAATYLMARCCRAVLQKSARTSAISWCWRTQVAWWDAVLYIFMGCTWRKSGLSRSIPRIKVQAAVSFWYGRCCRKRRSTLSPAFAFLPGSRNFSPNSVLPWRNEKICRTKFIKIAAFVHVFTAAMKSLW